MSMYCRNCGCEIEDGASICTKCGFETGKGVNYCFHCGKPTQEGQSVCTSCGFELKSSKKKSVSVGGGSESDLKRTNDGKILAGVCAGLEKYKGINKTVSRLIFLFILSWNFGLILYIILCFVMPMEE